MFHTNWMGKAIGNKAMLMKQKLDTEAAVSVTLCTIYH